MGEKEQGGILRNVVVLALILLIALGLVFGIRALWLHSDKNQSSASNMSTLATYNRWQSHYIKQDKAGRSYINSSDDKSYQTGISEAQGYGLYIVATASQRGIDRDGQKRFDSLYDYYKANNSRGTHLMSWYQKYDTSSNLLSKDDNNATDGDLYAAHALIQASQAYQNKKDYYMSEAKAILSDILKYNYNPDKEILTTGNWVEKNTPAYNAFRSSDVIPMFFEEFAKTTGDKRWLRISQSMTSKLNDMSKSTRSGLVSDMVSVEGRVPTPIRLGSDDDTLYGYNAVRVPVVLSKTTNTDANAVSDRILNFFQQQPDYMGTYNLDGSVVGNYHSDLQTAVINYAASNRPGFQRLKNATQSKMDKSSNTYSYYTDTVGLIGDFQK